jgi:hypothetical protein
MLTDGKIAMMKVENVKLLVGQQLYSYIVNGYVLV